MWCDLQQLSAQCAMALQGSCSLAWSVGLVRWVGLFMFVSLAGWFDWLVACLITSNTRRKPISVDSCLVAAAGWMPVGHQSFCSTTYRASTCQARRTSGINSGYHLQTGEAILGTLRIWEKLRVAIIGYPSCLIAGCSPWEGHGVLVPSWPPVITA